MQKILGVSRVTMWRLMNRQARVDDDKLRILLSLISEKEFREILGASKLLQSAGIIKEDGTISLLFGYGNIKACCQGRIFEEPDY